MMRLMHAGYLIIRNNVNLASLEDFERLTSIEAHWGSYTAGGGNYSIYIEGDDL